MAWDGLAAAVWWAHGTVVVLSPWMSMGRLRTEEPHIPAWGQILHSPQAEHGSSRHSERRSCPVQCGLGIEDPFNADVSPSRAQRCSETSIWAPPREVWTSCCSDKRVRSLTLCTSEIHIPFQVSLFIDASWKLLSNPMVGCAPVVVLATQPQPPWASMAPSLESQEGTRGARGQLGLVTSVPGGLRSLFVPATAPSCAQAAVLGPNLL